MDYFDTAKKYRNKRIKKLISILINILIILIVAIIAWQIGVRDRNNIIAVSSMSKPPELIMKKLNEYNVSSIAKVASSYKFCLIADGTFDIYAAKERANEWDYAAGHAVAENAGAIITTLDNQTFKYGKSDYKNLSLIIKRNEILDA